MSGWARSLLKVGVIFFSLLATAGVAAYLTVVVLVPPERVVVPRVVGEEFGQAVLLLSRNKLSARVIRRKFSREIPVDVVISQTPPPGTRVRENRSVELIISGGAQLVTSPDLTGMKLREAKISLSELGIDVGNVSYIYSKAPQDEVIAQDPPAGLRISREKGINLLLSDGQVRRRLMMPDLKGKKIEEVSSWLEDMSISIGMIKQERSLKEEGVVISQSPPPGSIIDRESRVELVVSGRGEKEVQKRPQQRWILTYVQVPLGFKRKKVSAVIIDEQGRKELDYGLHSPGEKVWISSEVIGKGEVKVYIDDQLVKIEKVEG